VIGNIDEEKNYLKDANLLLHQIQTKKWTSLVSNTLA